MFDASDNLVVGFDEAMAMHMAWLRKILRLVFLGTPPGPDVLAKNAHQLCDLSAWLDRAMGQLEALDEKKVVELLDVHEQLHEQVRELCVKFSLSQQVTAEELDDIEKVHVRVLNLLSEFKTLATVATVSIDTLTGLSTRNPLDKDYLFLKKQCSRHNQFLAVMMLDIDHFKKINDQYGHSGGDKVLHQLAQVLKNTIRGNDHIYRYGGEEFVIFSEASDQQTAMAMARRVHAAIGDMTVTVSADEVVQITVTLGCAIAGEHEDAGDAIERADKALYFGKSHGRNAVVSAETDCQLWLLENMAADTPGSNVVQQA